MGDGALDGTLATQHRSAAHWTHPNGRHQPRPAAPVQFQLVYKTWSPPACTHRYPKLRELEWHGHLRGDSYRVEEHLLQPALMGSWTQLRWSTVFSI